MLVLPTLTLSFAQSSYPHLLLKYTVTLCSFTGIIRLLGLPLNLAPEAEWEFSTKAPSFLKKNHENAINLISKVLLRMRYRYMQLKWVFSSIQQLFGLDQ